MVNVGFPKTSEPVVDRRGYITRAWQRYLSQIFLRTGGDTDMVEASSSPGDIKLTGRSTAPTGWLLCDGSAVSRTTYADLFDAIGTAYGTGDGSTTFNLPDGRGRMFIGAGTGTGLTARFLGDTGGAETHQLTLAEMPAHGHKSTESLVNDAAGTEYEATVGTKGVAATIETSDIGGDTPHENMSPFIVANWIIKV